MNLLVLDESLEVAGWIARLGRMRGWQPRVVGSLHDLSLHLIGDAIARRLKGST